MMQRGVAVFAIRRRWSWFVLPALLFSLGCGTPKGDISGKVTYQDKPLAGGTVTFFNAENRMVGSAPISDAGDYSMSRVPIGPVKITVAAPPIVVRNPNAPPPPTEPLPEGPGKRKAIEERELEIRRSSTFLDIPAKYGMPEQSDLTYDVQPGPQEHSIDLK